MALSATEVWRGGYVVDKTTGALIVTTNTAVLTRKYGGEVTDADGRLVVKSV